MDMLILLTEDQINFAKENYIKYLEMFGEDHSLTNFYKGELSAFERTLKNINRLK